MTRFRQSDVYAKFKPYSYEFTAKQWEAVRLCHGKEMTQAEAAAEVGVGRSAVSGLLSRAKKVMRRIDREIFAQAIEVTRRFEDS